MTRHRANELLNEATKRAAVIAGQITLHGHSPSLSEFENAKDFSGGSFETTVYGASGTAGWTNSGATPDQSFTLAITGVEEGVCELMQGIAADNAIIQQFAPSSCSGSNNTVKLTYNNDLGTEPVTPTQAPCPEGISRARDGSCSICDNGKVYLSYNDDPCDTEVSGDCTSNDDCGDDEFCNLTGSAMNYPDYGECQELDNPTPTTVGTLSNIIFSSFDMGSWWSAQNYCFAQGRTLLTISDFDCYRNGETLVDGTEMAQEVTCYPEGNTSHANSIISDLSIKCPSCQFFSSTEWPEDPGWPEHAGIFGIRTQDSWISFTGRFDSDRRAICR